MSSTKTRTETLSGYCPTQNKIEQIERTYVEIAVLGSPYVQYKEMQMFCPYISLKNGTCDIFNDCPVKNEEQKINKVGGITSAQSVISQEREGNDKVSQRKKYDLFISHANKDKLAYVYDLYQSLSQLGINIFYDIDIISWGDNWKTKILEGTATAEFAIIVISSNFFGREWTERELHEFLLRQNDSGQKIILPLLYQVTQEQLGSKYPQLTEIQCLIAENHTTENIAVLFAKELIKRLKEEHSAQSNTYKLVSKKKRYELKEEILKIVNIKMSVRTSQVAVQLNIEPKLAWELLRELCMHDREIISAGPISENDFDRNLWQKKKK